MSTPISRPMLSPALTPPMIPVVKRSASSSRALAVTGNPVIASCVPPMTPIPARSITIPAVTTREGFASIWIARTTEPGIAVRVILAMIAALPVMFMIRAMALLLKEEDDEYLRSRLVQQSLVATGFLLTIATLYGFLNTFDVAPRNHHVARAVTVCFNSAS